MDSYTAVDRPETKRKSGKTLILALVSAALCLALAVFALPKVFATPEKNFLNYHKKIISRYTSGMDAFKRISTDITLTAKTNSEYINAFLDGSSLTLKLDLSEGESLLEAGLSLGGKELFSGTFTCDDKGIFGVYSKDITGKYYTMDLFRFLAKMTDGEFDPEKYPRLTNEERKNLEKCLSDCVDIIFSTVNKDNLEVEKNVSFTLLELKESFEGTVYTFCPKPSDISATFRALADRIERDSDLDSALSAILNPGGDSLTGLLAQSLRDAADEAEAEMGEDDILWRLYVESNVPRMIVMGTIDEPEMLRYERAGSASDGTREYLCVGGLEIRNEFNVNGSVHTGKCVVSFDGEEAASAGYELDMSRRSALGVYYGRMELSLPAMDIRVTADVRENGDGADHIISLHVPGEFFDGEFDTLTVTLHAANKGTAKKPAAAAVDITDYTDAQLEKLLSEFAQKLLSKIYY